MIGDVGVTHVQVLIAGLQQQLAQMSARLDTMRIGDGARYSAHQFAAMRHAADELFNDWSLAQFLIERLQRRCCSMAESTA